jgi:hypothetical protein
MTPLHTAPKARQLPVGLGASAVWQLSDARKLTLFVIDPAVPLYNVVIVSLRFFADANQLAAFVERLDAAPAERPLPPTWQWIFESGFEQSLDGARNKRWCLHER